jgi:phosphohistidine phosphatase
MARWLEAHLPKGTRVLVSPAVRAQETARALAMDFETVQAIEPGASPEALLRAAGWPKAKHPVLVVGHQPTLGEALSLVVSGHTGEWSLKKGAIVWLSRRVHDEQAEVVLKAALSPELL